MATEKKKLVPPASTLKPVAGELLEVVAALQRLDQTIDLVRRHLENRLPGERPGVRVLAALMDSYDVQRRLLNLAIALECEESDRQGRLDA